MHLEIPGGDFSGYIFDLDGTLVDSMPQHFAAWDEAMRRAGLAHGLDEDYFYSLGGVPTRRVAEIMGEHYGLRLDPEKVFREKEALYAELQDGVGLIKPVVEFARRAARERPVSVASGGGREIVRRTLELAGLETLFPVVVTPEDVARGKPAPDMFNLAAQMMGVPPRECLVFEDGAPGIAAAEATGMKWVRVASRGVSSS